MSFYEQASLNVINGTFALLGVLIGLVIPILKDFLNNKNFQKLERIKIHDTDKITAYKKAFVFSSTLKVKFWDTKQKSDLSFLNACSGKLHEVLSDLPYFSSDLRSLLLEIESLLEDVIINFSDSDANCENINKKIPIMFKKLNKQLLDDFRKWE